MQGGAEMVSPISEPKSFEEYTPRDWAMYWSSQEGENYLEEMRELVRVLFKWDLAVSDAYITDGTFDLLKCEALQELLCLGEIEISTKVHRLDGNGWAYTYTRRKLS